MPKTPIKQRKRMSGGARLKASGKLPVLFGLTPTDKATLQRAAISERRPLSQFMLWHSLEAAKRILAMNEQKLTT